jgi:hypothetical protein
MNTWKYYFLMVDDIGFVWIAHGLTPRCHAPRG